MSRAQRYEEIAAVEYFVERMTEHDLLEVVSIEETCGLSLWGWDAYRAELDRPEAIMLVARNQLADPLSGESLCGFIAARLSTDELHVNNIGVRQSLRGCGVGGALMSTALRLGAETLGARTALLEVRATNTTAQSLYRRFGFEVVGRRKNYYRQPTDDALIMRAVLRPKA
jgi:ribosomal-protein-alanine N-acetyltransferase